MSDINVSQEEVVAMERRGRLVAKVMEACPTRLEQMQFLESLLAVIHVDTKNQNLVESDPDDDMTVPAAMMDDEDPGYVGEDQSDWDSVAETGDDAGSRPIIHGVTRLMRTVWFIDVGQMRPDRAKETVDNFRKEIELGRIDLGPDWIREDIYVPNKGRADVVTTTIEL